MATTQQFSLRWNNFHSNLSSGFHELLESAEMVDVTLAVDGKFLQAHKVVLSICSPYFRQMFKANPCKHPIVILKDVEHENMKDILEFMYMGEVSVLRDNLTQFLRTAELLQVKGLTGDDSSETSSKKEEKLDCDNEIDDEPEVVPQYEQSEFLNNAPREPTPPPQQLQHHQYQHQHHNKLPHVLQTPNLNSKRGHKNLYAFYAAKRTKVDNNANQNITNKMSIEEPSCGGSLDNIRRLVEESEYTDISNIKSDKPSMEEESPESVRSIFERSGSSENFPEHDIMYQGDSKLYVYCPYCERKFVNRYNLKVHVRDKHEDNTSSNLDCGICGKTMRNRSCLRVHMYHHRKQVENIDQIPLDSTPLQ